MSEQAVQRALEVKRRHKDELLRKPNVVAVEVGFHTRAGQPTAEVCLAGAAGHSVTRSRRKQNTASMLESAHLFGLFIGAGDDST